MVSTLDSNFRAIGLSYRAIGDIIADLRSKMRSGCLRSDEKLIALSWNFVDNSKAMSSTLDSNLIAIGPGYYAIGGIMADLRSKIEVGMHTK